MAYFKQKQIGATYNAEAVFSGVLEEVKDSFADVMEQSWAYLSADFEACLQQVYYIKI